MEPFLLLAVFLGSIPVTVYLDSRRRRRLVVRWQQVAREAGIEPLPGSPWTSALLTGFVGRQPVRFEEHAPSKNEKGIRIVLETDSQVTLRREDFGTKVEKAMGARELEIGDPAFDAEVYVHGAPEVLRAILDVPTRRAVRGLLHGVLVAERTATLIRVQARVNDGDVLVEFREQATETLQKELPGVLPGLVDLAQRLARPGSIPERIAENTRAEPEAEVRLQNLLLLASLYPRHAATRAALARGCRDSDEEVQIRAALALGADDARDALLEIAGRERGDEACAARAVHALGRRLPLDRALSILRYALRARRLGLAEVCVECIGHVGGPGSVDPLARVLAVESGDLAVAAARALRATGQPAAEPALLAALPRDLPELRIAAAQALGRVGTVAAVLPLKVAASRSLLDGDLRRAAREAVAEIQARQRGATPGQLSLAEDRAGNLSLADQDPRGRVSVADR